MDRWESTEDHGYLIATATVPPAGCQQVGYSMQLPYCQRDGMKDQLKPFLINLLRATLLLLQQTTPHPLHKGLEQNLTLLLVL